MPSTNQETLTSKLTKVADSIRSKSGSTDKMTLDEMPDAIDKFGDITLDEVFQFFRDAYRNFASSGRILRWNDIDSKSFYLLDNLLTKNSKTDYIKLPLWQNLHLVPQTNTNAGYVYNDESSVKAYNQLVEKTKSEIEKIVSSFPTIAYAQFENLALPNFRMVIPSVNSGYASLTVRTTYVFNGVKTIGISSFVDFGTEVSNYHNTNYQFLVFPDCTKIDNFSFDNSQCGGVNLPNVSNLPGGSFRNTSAVKVKVGGDIEKIDASQYNAVFNLTAGERRLSALILSGNKVPTLSSTGSLFGNVSADDSASGNGGYGEVPKNTYIYVPQALLNDYKNATNWSVFADHILPIEEHLNVCTLPGDDGYTGDYVSTNPTADKEDDAQ